MYSRGELTLAYPPSIYSIGEVTLAYPPSMYSIGEPTLTSAQDKKMLNPDIGREKARKDDQN